MNSPGNRERSTLAGLGPATIAIGFSAAKMIRRAQRVTWYLNHTARYLNHTGRAILRLCTVSRLLISAWFVPGRLVSRMLVMGWLAAGCLLIGCDRPTASSSHSEPQPQKPQQLQQQIDAVRRGETTEISLRIPVTDDEFASLASIAQQVTSLQLYRLQLLYPATSGLRSFKELAVLRIEGQSVSDSLVDEIVRLKKLQVLNLPAGGVTDGHLQRFSELPRLRLLRVSGSRITDAGMAYLPHFPQLRFLHLIDVSVTDAGLEPLRRCPRLESFYLDRTDGITDQGLRQLLQDCPEIHFHRDQLHLPDDPQADHE